MLCRHALRLLRPHSPPHRHGDLLAPQPQRLHYALHDQLSQPASLHHRAVEEGQRRAESPGSEPAEGRGSDSYPRGIEVNVNARTGAECTEPGAVWAAEWDYAAADRISESLLVCARNEGVGYEDVVKRKSDPSKMADGGCWCVSITFAWPGKEVKKLVRCNSAVVADVPGSIGGARRKPASSALLVELTPQYSPHCILELSDEQRISRESRLLQNFAGHSISTSVRVFLDYAATSEMANKFLRIRGRKKYLIRYVEMELVGLSGSVYLIHLSQL
jgi:hypothetical protein